MKFAPLVTAVAFTLLAGAAVADQRTTVNANGVFQSQTGQRNEQFMNLGSINSNNNRVSTNVNATDVRQTQTGRLNDQLMQIGSVNTSTSRPIHTDVTVRDVTQQQSGNRNYQRMRIGVVY